MEARPPMPDELMSMMERMCRLGELLNRADIDTTIENGDTNKIAEIEIILAEFNKAKAEMDVFLLEQKAKRLSQP
jgi:hypothetical protein